MKEKIKEILNKNLMIVDHKIYCERAADQIIELFKTELKTKLAEEIERISNL